MACILLRPLRPTPGVVESLQVTLKDKFSNSLSYSKASKVEARVFKLNEQLWSIPIRMEERT